MTLDKLIQANVIQDRLDEMRRVDKCITTSISNNMGDVLVKFSENGEWLSVPQKVAEYWLQFNKETSKELKEEFDKL